MDFGNAIENDTLKIGDLITIKNLKINSYLCAEGILLEDVVVNETIPSFEDALFCIHLQRQYSASNELETFTQTHKISSHTPIEDSNTVKYLQALRRGRDNENKLNESYMRQKMGTTVLFGDIIQLLHVKSGKFVTIVPDQLARDERENIRISLTAEGNSYSWLQLLPRFKIDREGDRILGGTEVLLKVAERPNEYIHCSEKDPPPEYFHEVNCSLESSSWKLSLFQNVKEVTDSNLLLCSQLVFIYDPETHSNVTVYSSTSREDDEEHSTLPSSEDAADVAIRPISVHGDVDTNSLWVIESKTIEVGGTVQWKNDLIRFRNLNTGRYLAMDQSGDDDASPTLCTATSSSAPGTLFSVQELYGNNSLLSDGKAIQMSVNGMWLARGDYDDETDTFPNYGTKDKNIAVSLLINRYKETQDRPGSKGKCSRGAVDEPLDVYVGVAARNFLNKIYERTKVPVSDYSAGTLWPGADRGEIVFFESILERTTLFAQGYSISTSSTLLHGPPQKNLIANRQNMMCDQGTLGILMKLIKKLIPISVRTDNTVSGVGAKSQAFKSEEEKAVITMGQTILRFSLNMLFYTIVRNPRNQMFVGDAMPILLAHVGAQQLAAKCVTDMLSSNMDLQEEKIGSREIKIFTEKLRSSKMNRMYLDLLRACCTCQGRGVVGNQIIVSEVVFKDFNDIVIQVHSDTARPVRVEWDRGLYIPASKEAASPMLGQSLVSKGLPQLSLSWTTNSIDFSPLGLFGKLSVNIQELYGVAGPGDRFGERITGTTQENKLAVAEYFASELFLAASMCLGRNYVAMRSLEKLFTYESLVTMIKMNVNETLKSAAVTLVMRLYVDRDPQVISCVPCLTRTWSEITRNPIPQLPYVDISRKNHFALLQQLISEHVHHMRGNPWDGLSVHMMQLMHKLVMFNFYGTTEKLMDVIGPLIAALDRRRLDEGTEESTQRPKSRSGTSSSKKRPRIQRGPSKVMTEISAGNGSFESMGTEADGDSWQRRMLTFLESLPVVIFVVLLVVVALSVLVSQTFTGATGPSYTYFEYFVTAVFCAEILLRFYCYVAVEQVVVPFFLNILNVIDIVVVIIDVFIIAAPGVLGSGAKYTKSLRVARLVRLVRVFRAARLVQKLKDMAVKQYDEWQLPERYANAPEHELETMVEAVNILAYVQRIVEDRNLSILLRGFHQWESGADTRSPTEIFRKVVAECREISLGCDGFDDIFIDNLMLTNADLVQVLLDVLMAHHSSTMVLIENAKKVQLLVSSKRERQYRNIDHFLLDLERFSETNELWGELKTEADRRTDKAIKDILRDLTDLCRVQRKVLEFDEDFAPDPSIQNLLRNLGFFDVAFKVLRLLNEIDEATKPLAAQNNRDIVALCNELLYWFVIENSENQALAYDHLEFFLNTLDMDIGSHKIIHAIFKNNEALMKACPRSYIAEFTEKVCRQGRHPQYLSLLASITHAGEKNVLENQYETVKQLIAPARLQKMVVFFCPVDHPSYQEKVEMMAPFLDKKTDISVYDLPHELGYHLEFLRVLSGCTVGRINITTVEAKVQSVFDAKDIIDAILDPRSILLAKCRLGLFLFNAMIEVEIVIPGMGQSAAMWRLLQSYVKVFEDAVPSLQEIEKHGWGGSGVRRQEIEYVVVCAMIVSGFFQTCYDPAKIKTDDTVVPVGDMVQMTLTEIHELISTLFTCVKNIYEPNFSSLSEEHKKYLMFAMDSLSKSAGKSLVMDFSAPLVDKGDDENEEESGVELLDVSTSNNEVRVTKKYSEFLAALVDSDDVREIASEENKHFIAKIEKLPFVDNTSVVSDVRYEPFIKKLVAHVRDRLEIVDNVKRLDSRCVQTTTWIIRSFRTMIENRWGMSIYERDEDGGEEEDIAAAPVVNALNSCGATTLCLDLISVGIDAGLMLESVKLCVAMLFLEGGNLPVQQTMFDYLDNNDSELFFRQMRISIQDLINWHKWNDVIVLEEDEEPDLPEDIVIVRFLQLMCEGHYQPNQDIMREQPNNASSVNLLDDFVSYLNCVSRIPCRTSTNAGTRVSATILEVIQGPCQKNQEHFVLNTELVETINRLMRTKPVRDCVPVEELELKKTGIDILQGLLEGQGGLKTVYERVLSVIHLDIIELMCAPSTEEDEIDSEEVAEATTVLRTESLVLLQMLCDYKPSLRNELQFVKDATDIVGAEVACVEILWRGELQRRFFHIPKICFDLAKASKDALVEDVDRSNLESKLQDFVFRSHELYREIKHQQVLKEWHVSGIFSRANQNRATWISFFLACIINLLLLCYYTAKGGDGPRMPEEIRIVVDALNTFQLVFATFTLILFLVVRVPVKYQHYEAAGYSKLMTVVYTSVDALTMYYFVYMIFCLLAINYSDIFLTFLLLDIIVKNSTTRDVLLAVINPRKQLAMTLLLGIFVTYIFSFFIFFNFRDEFLDGETKKDCENLYKCFKYCVGYGVRLQNGTGDLMTHTLDTRYAIDVIYFLIVLIVLLNVIFGIIIDTFGDLRSKKIERLHDTTEKCFMCGIDKQIFDRAADTPNGFKTHIRFDHNMWNYLYFIIYVWEQDKDDDDGLEQYVRRSLDSNDIGWFPMNRAMRLAVTSSAEDELRSHLSSDVESADKNLQAKIHQFQSSIGETLDKIVFHLKHDNDEADINRDNALSAERSRSPEALASPMLSTPMAKFSDNRSMASSKRMRSSVASRGGDNFSHLSDDMSYTSNNRSSTPQGERKQVSLQIQSIHNVGSMVPVDVSSVSDLLCVITCDTGKHEIPIERCEDGTLIMSSKEIIACESTSPGDIRSCRIVLQKGREGEVDPKTVAAVDFSYDELIALSTERKDSHRKEFRTVENESTGCFVQVCITCASAIDLDGVSINERSG